MGWSVEVSGSNWAEVQQHLDEWAATQSFVSKDREQFKVANNAARLTFDHVAHPGTPCRVAMTGESTGEGELDAHLAVIVMVDQ